jgi:alpha-beta hydrolase superfamily lysophospholipase
MPSIIGDVTTPDGRRLRTRRWPTADAASWASILIVHGLAEHSGRYEHVGEQLAAAGLAVHAIDLRGFGGSDGPRADVADWSELESDVETGLAMVREEADRGPESRRPTAVYAHSMGGLVTLGAVIRGGSRPDLLVLSAPGLDSSEGRALRALAAALNRLAPTLRIRGRANLDTLSRDPTVGERFAADPLTAHSGTVRFAAAAFAAQRLVTAAVPELVALGIPTLVIHGGDDRRVPTSATEGLGGLSTVTRRLYPGLRHELHNEPEGPQVVADVIEWLRSQV